MTDAAFISPYRFASTGDEKVTRIFDAPAGFVESLESLGVAGGSRDTVCVLRLTSWPNYAWKADHQSSRPKGATVPPLGLSNRALGRGELSI
jgi:elongator complex protein 2